MSEINFKPDVNNSNNDKKEHVKKPVFETKKDLIMYYQTSIRNVFLSTAVSFAALGYSRFYRDKSKIYTIGMVFVSLLLILSSLMLNVFLYNHINEYMKKLDFMEINKWLNINKLAIMFHVILLFFVLHTLYRLFFNKQFTKSS